MNETGHFVQITEIGDLVQINEIREQTATAHSKGERQWVNAKTTPTESQST
jgi:hypothetical protein